MHLTSTVAWRFQFRWLRWCLSHLCSAVLTLTRLTVPSLRSLPSFSQSLRKIRVSSNICSPLCRQYLLLPVLQWRRTFHLSQVSFNLTQVKEWIQYFLSDLHRNAPSDFYDSRIRFLMVSLVLMRSIVSRLSRKLNENLHVLFYIENVLIATEVYHILWKNFKNPSGFLWVRKELHRFQVFNFPQKQSKRAFSPSTLISE